MLRQLNPLCQEVDLIMPTWRSHFALASLWTLQLLNEACQGAGGMALDAKVQTLLGPSLLTS